jgi:hypothetical protein
LCPPDVANEPPISDLPGPSKINALNKLAAATPMTVFESMTSVSSLANALLLVIVSGPPLGINRLPVAMDAVLMVSSATTPGATVIALTVSVAVLLDVTV